MAELVPLKVSIGLRQNGHADHPDFGQLAVVAASGLSWDAYIDRHGSGWLYDVASGHSEQDDDSPMGTQQGMVMVPREFATQAIAAFPDQCSLLQNAQAKDFYEKRHRVKSTRLKRDPAVLHGLLLEIQLQEKLIEHATTAEEREKYQRRLNNALDDARDITDADKKTVGVTHTPGFTFDEKLTELAAEVPEDSVISELMPDTLVGDDGDDDTVPADPSDDDTLTGMEGDI